MALQLFSSTASPPAETYCFGWHSLCRTQLLMKKHIGPFQHMSRASQYSARRQVTFTFCKCHYLPTETKAIKQEPFPSNCVILVTKPEN